MFLFDILMDTNKANVATWEDQKGMFRIRDPTRLAEMWGEKRNRTNMTYEKLSRSLRHYYEKKILRKVPKRKYTYKFNSREILKSYEVQPFYRRSNANSHRNNQNQQNYKQLSSSGQSSPFTPVTPLTPVTPSSNYQQASHFQWPQVSTYQPNWPTIKQEPGSVISLPSPIQMPPTPSISPLSQQVSPLNNSNGYPVNHSNQQQQHQPSQQQFVPIDAWNQQCFYPQVSHGQTQPMQFPCGEVIPQPQYTVNMVPVSVNTTGYQQYPISSHQHQGQPMITNCKSSMEDTKASVQHEINQLQEMLEKPKCYTKPAQLTLTIPAVPNTTSYSASPALCTQRSRSQSIDSYVSTSPDSFMESDDIFNDIVDSLLLDSF